MAAIHQVQQQPQVFWGQFHNFPGACRNYFPELILPKKLLGFYHTDRARRVDVKWLKPEATLVCTSVLRSWDWEQILKTLHLLFSHAAKPRCLFSSRQKGSLSALRELEALLRESDLLLKGNTNGKVQGRQCQAPQFAWETAVAVQEENMSQLLQTVNS